MTLSHNSIIRGFNSIYQQAPRVTAKDQDDFICYCLAWHRFVEKHHHYEEEHFFPAIERAAGVKGIMDDQIEGHRKSSLDYSISASLIVFRRIQGRTFVFQVLP